MLTPPPGKGNMTRVGDESWFINSVVGNSGEETSITVTHPRLKTQPWAYNTLEGYGVGDCSYEPTKPCLFTNLVLTSNGQTVGGALDACLLATALSSPHSIYPPPPYFPLRLRSRPLGWSTRSRTQRQSATRKSLSSRPRP